MERYVQWHVIRNKLIMILMCLKCLVSILFLLFFSKYFLDKHYFPNYFAWKHSLYIYFCINLHQQLFSFSLSLYSFQVLVDLLQHQQAVLDCHLQQNTISNLYLRTISKSFTQLLRQHDSRSFSLQVKIHQTFEIRSKETQGLRSDQQHTYQYTILPLRQHYSV